MKTKPVLAAIVVGSLLLAFCLPTQAAGAIYRWVDERGQTQLSDTVPDQHQKSAVKIDARKFEATREQRREAEARAAREKALAKENHDKRSQASSKGPVQPAPAASGSGPTQLTGNNDIDCPILYRQYKESADCFAPYRNVNGSVKAEAYNRCTSIPSPAPRCGPAPHGWATE